MITDTIFLFNKKGRKQENFKNSQLVIILQVTLIINIIIIFNQIFRLKLLNFINEILNNDKYYCSKR